jgi:pimeloyl-ACP methyl ester carboxylesterase
MPVFQHDGIAFSYREAGTGAPFFFQHGLGGDIDQPFGLVDPPAGIRMIAFDCRAHGNTQPLGDPAKISIGMFADDLLALMDQLDLKEAVVGGISMGAAVALNFALRYPARMTGLVLSRPAWLAEPNRDNAETFNLIAKLLKTHGAKGGKARFLESDLYRQVMTESIDVANSLCGQFDNPHAVERAIRLEQIPLDQPCSSLDEPAAIRVPTLVMSNRQDPIHPFHFGEILAGAIPGAVFRELTPKSVDAARHTADYQTHLGEFFRLTGAE